MTDWLLSNVDPESHLQFKILGSLLIIAALGLLRMLIVWIVDQRTESDRVRYNWRKLSSYLTFASGVILISPLWFNIESIATFLGLASAGLVIALRGPVNDLFAWIVIWWRRPLEIGDRIEIGQHAGDVVDIRVFQFTILEIGNWVQADQSTGRVLHIPNRKILEEPLANYHKGLGDIWNEIEVFITFESNWQKAKAMLEEIAERDAAQFSQDAAERVRRAARRYLIYYPHLTPIVYMRVERSGVLLTLRYLCDPRQRRSTEQKIWEDILDSFAQQEDIEFAYPTQRFYQRLAEGKATNNKPAFVEKQVE